MDHIYGRWVGTGCVRGRRYYQIRDKVNGDDVKNQIVVTVEIVNQSEHRCESQSAHCGYRFCPAQHGLKGRADDNRGSYYCDLHVLLALDNSLLCQKLGECIRVWPFANNVLFVVCYLLRVHFEDFSDYRVGVLVTFVDLLHDPA